MMNLPPILDIIRGCSEQEYRMMWTVYRANRPQDKGERNNPYEDRVIQYIDGIAPSGTINGLIDIASQESERINELELRLSQLEEMIDELSHRLDQYEAR